LVEEINQNHLKQRAGSINKNAERIDVPMVHLVLLKEFDTLDYLVNNLKKKI
jgi:hypothetical protein